ncbi:PREDICTED: uncharacterized protein LOC105556332 isoform X1 [Vollenhovia emeryi]|uniref:uncharacterized protein LOC105556332 isoform X1 n=1 Tax=Vollenhovia emeryi TaxID=411798 RepID=UPI0005F3EA6D|nr:PREDICTED: uncharacterized protein LOC105556332 isoform X1 [Vollenhovia emeryi]
MNFILDAPARSLVKCCIGHGGYGACEKCIVIGETVHSRRVYIELNEPLRTDESFKNKEQPLHHCGQSPLEQINIGMVSQFRLDPFHLAWHGVFRRLLDVWLTWNGPWKLHREIRWNISFLLLSIADTCPSDFVRKPRSLKEWTMYKATEERRLCLYDGIVVFKDNLHKNVYRHFLMLHGALTILSSPMLVQSEIMCYYADDLLKAFINHSIVIYGKIFVVYNVHALAHLAQECLSHGSLDEFSAFPFENFLKSLKSLLKSGYKPLQQVARRDIEKTVSVSVHLSTNDKEVTLSHRHYYRGEVIEGSYFKKISIGDVVLKIGRRDSCFMTIDGNVFLLQNVVKRRKDIYLITNKFNKKEDFYVYPFPSSHLRIFKVSNLSDERIVVALADIQSKCWLIPYKEFFVSVPLLHTMPMF